MSHGLSGLNIKKELMLVMRQRKTNNISARATCSTLLGGDEISIYWFPSANLQQLWHHNCASKSLHQTIWKPENNYNRPKVVMRDCEFFKVLNTQAIWNLRTRILDTQILSSWERKNWRSCFLVHKAIFQVLISQLDGWSTTIIKYPNPSKQNFSG